MFENEKCPFCDAPIYHADSYKMDIVDDLMLWKWYCSCPRCKNHITITKVYKPIVKRIDYCENEDEINV